MDVGVIMITIVLCVCGCIFCLIIQVMHPIFTRRVQYFELNISSDS